MRRERAGRGSPRRGGATGRGEGKGGRGGRGSKQNLTKSFAEAERDILRDWIQQRNEALQREQKEIEKTQAAALEIDTTRRRRRGKSRGADSLTMTASPARSASPTARSPPSSPFRGLAEGERRRPGDSALFEEDDDMIGDDYVLRGSDHSLERSAAPSRGGGRAPARGEVAREAAVPMPPQEEGPEEAEVLEVRVREERAVDEGVLEVQSAPPADAMPGRGRKGKENQFGARANEPVDRKRGTEKGKPLRKERANDSDAQQFLDTALGGDSAAPDPERRHGQRHTQPTNPRPSPSPHWSGQERGHGNKNSQRKHATAPFPVRAPEPLSRSSLQTLHVTQNSGMPLSSQGVVGLHERKLGWEINAGGWRAAKKFRTLIVEAMRASLRPGFITPLQVTVALQSAGYDLSLSDTDKLLEGLSSGGGSHVDVADLLQTFLDIASHTEWYHQAAGGTVPMQADGSHLSAARHTNEREPTLRDSALFASSGLGRLLANKPMDASADLGLGASAGAGTLPVRLLAATAGGAGGHRHHAREPYAPEPSALVEATRRASAGAYVAANQALEQLPIADIVSHVQRAEHEAVEQLQLVDVEGLPGFARGGRTAALMYPFRERDPDRIGILGLQAFDDALHDLGVLLTPQEVLSLAHKYRPRHSAAAPQMEDVRTAAFIPPPLDIDDQQLFGGAHGGDRSDSDRDSDRGHGHQRGRRPGHGTGHGRRAGPHGKPNSRAHNREAPVHHQHGPRGRRTDHHRHERDRNRGHDGGHAQDWSDGYDFDDEREREAREHARNRAYGHERGHNTRNQYSDSHNRLHKHETERDHHPHHQTHHGHHGHHAPHHSREDHRHHRHHHHHHHHHHHPHHRHAHGASAPVLVEYGPFVRFMVTHTTHRARFDWDARDAWREEGASLPEEDSVSDVDDSRDHHRRPGPSARYEDPKRGRSRCVACKHRLSQEKALGQLKDGIRRDQDIFDSDSDEYNVDRYYDPDKRGSHRSRAEGRCTHCGKRLPSEGNGHRSHDVRGRTRGRQRHRSRSPSEDSASYSDEDDRRGRHRRRGTSRQKPPRVTDRHSYAKSHHRTR